MKKVKLLLIVLCSVLMIDVQAVSSNASIGSDMTEYSCSAFQDDDMHISGDTYFGRCMQATCNGSKWVLRYYSTNSVTCANGNVNPYVIPTKSGCTSYQNNSCKGSSVKYCTTISYFDCNRTSNGSKYTTTTKKKPTSTTSTTTSTTTATTTTEVVKDNNTNLSNIILSNGVIQFNKDVKEYSIEVESTISFINVQATPEVETSKVSVTGNSNLVAGANKITITVTAEDGSVGTYVINVNKKEVVSNNTRLSSLTVKDYDLNPAFDPNQYAYTIKTKESSLNIEAETEDQNAIYMIEGNDNLKNNSVIKVIVTAADGLTMKEYSITIKSGNSAGIITTIFIVIIAVVVIGGGAFYFYTKRKNGGEKEYEYE